MTWNYYGNDAAVSLLRAHIAQGSLRQAYLFCGPEGIGRRTLALRLAQAVNCLNPPQAGDLCGVCRSCRLIAEMRHPDLDIVAADQRGGVLRVDQIRELQHRLSLAPYEGHYRIALILRFEEANLNAQNALLKTLEEPPRRVILLITAQDREQLLPTIVSRCEVVRLRPLAVSALAQTLIEEQRADPTLTAQIARLAAGRPGIALRMLSNPSLQREQLRIIEEHLSLLNSSPLDRFALAEQLAKERSKAEIHSLIENWLALWRDVILCAHDHQQHLTYSDFSEPFAEIADQIGKEQSLAVIRELCRTLEILQGNVNLRLVLEVLFLSLPRLALRPFQAQSTLENAHSG